MNKNYEELRKPETVKVTFSQLLTLISSAIPGILDGSLHSTEFGVTITLRAGDTYIYELGKQGE